ncbi:hypothetical protein SPSIL_058020 [Sporomusa silvacetica DSM 10669]|uniref:DNA replication and repair protein RecF n=1 Tax=Sporomusa silvacetica DSM 10669 TaxID=1123289 RepID=A0ABZ3IW24_9FIRM|nr:AAA family ATPase [Sporomusa silvacetica]OZC14250.1 DNA replication and repair protein RecF [Sporomusa silvacetica DSM 10669]
MCIQIDTIRIAGFRGIQNIEITLPRVTVLIGANNSGKTSVLKAMQLALGDYSRYLSEEDFHIGSDDKRASEILIDIRIIPVNMQGLRITEFNEEWMAELGDSIKPEVNNNQFVALRTRIAPNMIKGGFEISRSTLEKWTDFSTWRSEKMKETKLSARMQSISMISIDAQRDIHQELKERSSFVGRVLTNVEYSDDDMKDLEKRIKEVNDQAVQKSDELQNLKTHLEELNQSFQGSGNAEITPFPKKLRDLSKHFSIHFGESSGTAFSMEYHGMGTRSWASILTVKAFIDAMIAQHEKEVIPFFPILAAEEPEAHLHPNAQKTLYRQLAGTYGQVIISTHSSYVAALANQSELRYLKSQNGEIISRALCSELEAEAQRRIQREIIHSRGEILFSKAWILCEGETEEQALPCLFEKYFGHEAFEMGVSIIGIGGSGKKYVPFLTFARDFDIPVFIFSDGEAAAVKDLKKYYDKVFGTTDVSNCPYITILDGTDFEGYLLNTGFIKTVENAINSVDGKDTIENWITKKNQTPAGRRKTNQPRCKTCKQEIFEDVLRDYKSSDGYNTALLDILDSAKPKYAPVIAEKLCELDANDFPKKIIELFEKIKAGVKL